MSSVAFDKCGKIVPFGQDFVFDDMPLTLTLKERVAFFLCLIDVSVDSRKYSEYEVRFSWSVECGVHPPHSTIN